MPHSKRRSAIPIRPAALSLPEVRVVEASAGSGKTYALALRYIRLLMAPGEELRAILAITFTNKATREMKARILELLKRLALGAFRSRAEKVELLASLSAGEAAARTLSASLVDRIVRNYHWFQVQTIDSFINVLLSGCAAELNLSPRFRIERSSGEHLSWALDRCIERAGREAPVRRAIRAFVDQHLRLDRQASWFPRDKMRSTVEALIAEYNLSGKRFAKSGCSPRATKRKLLADLAALRSSLPAGTRAHLVKALDDVVGKGGGALDLGDLTSAYFLRDDFPMTKGNEAPPGCLALWRRIRAAIPRAAEEEARSFFDCYIDLFDLVSGELASRAREDDLVFLNELNRLARELFSSGRVGVPELYLRLATEFRHFLIDEFQDTSDLQWNNLEGMVREALSTGGSLFYVGDRKQAIYRFRGGDVGLFDAVAAGLAGQAPVRRESLGLNRRSAREIVEFNNEVFSEQNLRRFAAAVRPDRDDDPKALGPCDVDMLVEAFRGARQTHLPGRPGGCVRVEALEAAPGEEAKEAARERMIAIVRGLCGRYDPGQIAVLARGNDDVERITAWLTEARIAAASDRTLSVARNPLVKELIALLRFLDSPVDDLAFASFILGEIFSAAAGIPVREMRRFVFSLRSTPAAGRGSHLYMEFRARYPDAWAAHIEEFFRTVGFVPLYELVAQILQRLGVYRRFGEYQGFFMRFLELVREQEEERGDIGSFLGYLDRAAGEDLFVRFSGVDAVRVMTAHKAKGLGFPAVVLPFLDFDPEGGGPRQGAAYRALHGDAGVSLLCLERKYTDLSPRLAHEGRAEYLGRFVDAMNLVYVAFTRAEEELWILIPYSKRRGNRALELIPGRVARRGEPGIRKRRGPGADPGGVDLPPPEYRDWIAFLKEECVDAGEIVRRAEIERGDLSHFILSRIGAVARGDAGEALGRAVEEARLRFPLAGCVEECAEAVRALLSAPAVAPIFFPGEGAEVRSEIEVADRNGRRWRIDRLIVLPDAVRIVDWKSSAAEREGHAAQMRAYAALVREIYPGRAVRASLVYLDSGEVEEVAV